MVEESTNQDEELTMYSNDGLVRAKIMEIPDNLPEEIKRQLQQFNEMSMMLNNSLDNPIAEEDSDDDDEDDESVEDSSPSPSFNDDANAVYSDIF